MQIAFIGLGKMGAGMARNLTQQFKVTVFDARSEAVQGLIEQGAREASSAIEAVKGADIVITMLPGPEEIESVFLGPNGVGARMQPKSLWIDMSSSSLSSMRRVLDAFPDREWSSLDAPVTGGVPGAEAGTLQIFVGGSEADFARAKPVFDVLGDPQKRVHAGALGTGYAIKLCLNLGFFLHAIAGTEIMLLGVKAGVDMEVLHRSLTGSGATSAFLENDLNNNIFAGDYKEYFRLALALKDIRLAVDLGRDVGVPLEVSALVEQMHRRALLTYGDGGQLLAVKQLEETAGIELRRS